MNPIKTRRRKSKLRQELIQRDGKLCGKCRKIMDKNEITIEHIKPKSCGGTDTPSNLRLYCKNCNQKLGRTLNDCFNKKSKSRRKCCDKYMKN